MGNEVPFRYRWAQQQASQILSEELKSGNPVREWWLKWRRAGLSSMSTAEFYALGYGRTNARLGIIAHLEDRAKELLNNYRFYHQSLKTWHPELVIQLAKDNIFGIKWEGINSQVLIATAENPIKVRGDGIHGLQNTEAAHFYSRFRAVMREVAPVVPPVAGSIIINESTGSLRGSAPYEHYMEAKYGKNEFKARFFCWLDSPDERIAITPRDFHDLCETIKFQEPRLAEKNAFFKLTPEQIACAWRMYHLQSDNDFDYFCREFPYTEEEAWSAGGASYFGTYELGKAKPEDPQEIYLFENHNICKIFNDYSELRRVTKADPYSVLPVLKIWTPPVPGERYVMGSDGGLGGFDGDPSAGYMRNARTREMCAAYHGVLRPDEQAHINVSLARIYNNALLAPETNPGGGGMEALNMIQRLGYHNIYRWRIRDGRKGLELSTKLGWWTHSRSRPLMLGEERKLFLDSVNERIKLKGLFKDAALIDEMRTFSADPSTGIPEALPNCYDDRVMADCITNQVITDEAYGTKADIIHEYHNMAHLAARAPINPEDQAALMTKRIADPSRVIDSLMNPRSAFNRNKFEI